MRTKHTFTLPADLMTRLRDYASRKGVTQSLVIEAALASHLSPDGAEYLVSLGVKLVGVDYLSVEQFHSGHHRTHRTLLERGIVIVEGLDLSAIAPGRYAFTCLPLRLEGLDGAPARAVLMTP